MGKMNVYNKIMIGNQTKRKIWKSKNVLHESPSNGWFRNGINVRNLTAYIKVKKLNSLRQCLMATRPTSHN